MTYVPVQIVRFVRDSFPGFVAAELIDAYGNTHTFEDKVPVLFDGHLDRMSAYPQPGVLMCEVVEQWTAEDGRTLVRIDTQKPYDIPSTAGAYQFVVPDAQVIAGNPWMQTHSGSDPSHEHQHLRVRGRGQRWPDVMNALNCRKRTQRSERFAGKSVFALLAFFCGNSTDAETGSTIGRRTAQSVLRVPATFLAFARAAKSHKGSARES